MMFIINFILRILLNSQLQVGNSQNLSFLLFQQIVGFVFIQSSLNILSIRHPLEVRKLDSISFVKPYQAVSRDTISRWIKNVVMIKSGIDVEVFKPHSTRAASTSKANACQVPIDMILKAASWKGDCTFRKFYNKPIVDNVSCFGQAILGTSTAV